MRQSIGLIFVAMLAICPESAWALANPASVFCAQSGGKSEIRKGPRGQYGVCRLPDGGSSTSGPTSERCGEGECARVQAQGQIANQHEAVSALVRSESRIGCIASHSGITPTANPGVRANEPSASTPDRMASRTRPSEC
jgi:putative hemolysin